MKKVQQYLEQKQKQFSFHPFFTYIEKNPTVETLAKFTPYLAFWVMVFQDILRLNESRITDPFLKEIAEHHRIEDSDHHLWFIEDMEELKNASSMDARWLFSKEFTSTRDAAYSLTSEVFHAFDDYMRVIALLTLESTGHIFFERCAKLVNTVDMEHKLKYFSKFHLDVEKDHELFEEEMEDKLFTIELPENKIEKAFTMIDRMYVAFQHMFDGLMPGLEGHVHDTPLRAEATAHA